MSEPRYIESSNLKSGGTGRMKIRSFAFRFLHGRFHRVLESQDNAPALMRKTDVENEQGKQMEQRTAQDHVYVVPFEAEGAHTFR